MARTESKTFSLFSVNNLSDKHSPPAPLSPHHLWTLLESACTLWLICGSFVHWLRCNCCSLAAQAPILFICTVGWGESELNVEGPGLYRENRKIPRADVGRPTSLIRQWPVPGLMWFLNHRYHPGFCISCPWLEIWVDLISGESRAEEKTRGALGEIYRRWKRSGLSKLWL